jgi:cytoskeletal protein CcmA (bactofilin family)
LYWRVQDLLKPPAKTPARIPKQRHITCFDCHADLEVSASAKSTMCKRCSCYIDLHDYSIAAAVSKNFKTKGSFQIQPAGYVFNSEAIVREAAIKGQFIGKLIVEGSLTLHSTAKIKGDLTAHVVIVPEGNQFRWQDRMHAGAVEIEGELVGDVEVHRTVHVSATGRLVGTLRATSLVADTGAVVEVEARIGPSER